MALEERLVQVVQEVAVEQVAWKLWRRPRRSPRRESLDALGSSEGSLPALLCLPVEGGLQCSRLYTNRVCSDCRAEARLRRHDSGLRREFLFVGRTGRASLRPAPQDSILKQSNELYGDVTEQAV